MVILKNGTFSYESSNLILVNNETIGTDSVCSWLMTSQRRSVEEDNEERLVVRKKNEAEI